MNKKMWKRTLILTIVSIVLVSGSVTAIWLLQIQDGLTANVVSVEGGTISITTNLQDLNLDTTTDKDESESIAIISNNNGNLTMTVSIEETRTDINDDCTDYINDVNAVYTIDNEEINNNDTINIGSGDTDLSVKVKAKSHSCPQTFNTTIVLTEI